MKEPILSFKEIHKKFGKKNILKGTSLELEKGDIMGLIGKSGCGKSTLLKILIGFHKQDSGTIHYKGKDITDNTDILKKVVGYTTQDNSFYDKLTVQENMLYYAELYNINSKKLGYSLQKHLHDILESVELHENKHVLALAMSGGMQRRLDFAISLIHNPEILILDEPTTGLDPLLIQQFWKIVQKIVKNGKTVLVSSHIFPELEQNCNKAAIMDKGKITKIINVKINKLYEEFKKSVL